MPWRPKSHEERVREQRPAPAKTADPFYKTAQWLTLREMVLNEQPVCAMCHNAAAAECDHIRPRLLFPALAYDRQNLQGLCRECHSRKTMNEQRARHQGLGKCPRVHRAGGGGSQKLGG